MKEFGFVRVGSIVNKLELACPMENSKELIKLIKECEKNNCGIVLTPELSLTGYTCGDLFLQDKLLSLTLKALENIKEETKDLNIISIIGLPLMHDNRLFNCAVVINRGHILGVVPKTYIPNYQEFYEKRWFSSSKNLLTKEINILGETVPIDTNIIFKDRENENISFAIEICEDLWTPNPPSTNHALNGASIIFNLSSSNEIIGKYDYRKNLIKMQSAKSICAYVYSSSGIRESTSDILFSGSSIIYENGTLLEENKRFSLESNIIISDIDTNIIVSDRRKNKSFLDNVVKQDYKRVYFNLDDNLKQIKRVYKKYPFVPSTKTKREKRCEEIINIQSNALLRRIMHTKAKKCIIGISGGLDSTLAFLVTYKAMTELGRNPKDIIGITLPGFGTTGRTYNNACLLVKEFGATLKEISIKEACLLHFKDIELDKNDRSVAYENTQARERTQILMDMANKEEGLVVGTGDMSELALGWCTYNGDHMSMYAVNSGIPKTLVRYLVEYFKDESDGKKKEVLEDILNTPISPELLPPDKNGKITQKTESQIGPYILHDFFLYHFLRYNLSPKKIYTIALKTFNNMYSKEEILKWLEVFFKRFFTQQFKRNCIPDGIKVGTIALSPRGDLRFPSDASYKEFIEELEELK